MTMWVRPHSTRVIGRRVLQLPSCLQVQGDANNAVLADAGYNFRHLVRWLSLLLWKILAGLIAPSQTPALQAALKAYPALGRQNYSRLSALQPALP